MAEYVALPITKICRHSQSVRRAVAAIFDPFGNAVHPASPLPVLGDGVLITGVGPIGPPMNINFSRCMLTIEAENDSQTPARILGLVTQRNCLPDWFSVRRKNNGFLCIVLEFYGLDMDASGLLVKKIANIPSIVSVSRMLTDHRAETAT